MKNIRVATVQFNHHANDKNYNLSIIQSYVEKAAKEGVKIIVFPEMCVTGYWHVSTLQKSFVGVHPARRNISTLARNV